MQQKISPYISFSREEWSDLRNDVPLILSEDDLEKLRGLNERLSMKDVTEIYLPLSRLLNLYVAATQELHNVSNKFLNKSTGKVPYIIGIAGSVAVGKSTTARLLQTLLSRWANHPKVDLVTTDGFLFPNQVLEKRGLMKRKGFPESYDIRKLLTFLSQVKSGRSHVTVPVYSHLAYDILPDQVQVINSPDILIVEGLNVLQMTRVVKRRLAPHLFVSDFFDFSIYVDANVKDIVNWYVERFKLLRSTAFQNPQSYFHRFSELSEAEAETMATQIWKEINEVNLVENILPTRERADLILHKGAAHSVSEVKLRRL